MRAIYITEKDFVFKRVFDETTKKKISKIFNIEDVCYNKSKLNDKDFKDVEIIFTSWGMCVLNEDEIKKIFPSLKCIFYAAGSVQFFARPFLNLGIKVFSAWQANAVPVIEFATSQILLANKGYYQLLAMAKKDYKLAREVNDEYPGNYNAKIGILGYGVIAKGVIKELLRHKVDIYVYAPDITHEEANKLGIHKADTLEEIFDNCLVISNHIANLPSTLGMINKDILSRLKSRQTFINTGRGQQVDEKTLLDICKNNPLICAVLDVTYPEPPEQDSLYFKLPNVYVTPHIAGSSGKEVIRMAEYMYEEAKRYLNKEKCPYEVTLKMLETMA